MFSMPVGLYEKALPAALGWEERLAAAGRAGYDFVEISIDESDGRLGRLDWSAAERAAGQGTETMAIYDAAMKYLASGTPTVVFAGEEYGTGSSRDWAAKGTQLLGIKAVVAKSFERIHRSNLVGMGVLPLQFKGADSWQTLNLQGDELIDVVIGGELKPQSDATLVITRADGSKQEVTVTLRIDTPIEVDYYKHGGILPFVLRQLLPA